MSLSYRCDAAGCGSKAEVLYKNPVERAMARSLGYDIDYFLIAYCPDHAAQGHKMVSEGKWIFIGDIKSITDNLL